jgi:hypothetical protein
MGAAVEDGVAEVSIAGRRFGGAAGRRWVSRLVRARRELAAQADGPIQWLRTGPVIAYRRGAVVVVMNGGTDPVTLPPQSGRTTVFSTDSAHRDHNGTRGAALTVQPNAAIIFRTQHASAPVVWP